MLREQILNTLTTKKEMMIIQHDGGRCQIQAYFQENKILTQLIDARYKLDKIHCSTKNGQHDLIANS